MSLLEWFGWAALGVAVLIWLRIFITVVGAVRGILENLSGISAAAVRATRRGSELVKKRKGVKS